MTDNQEDPTPPAEAEPTVGETRMVNVTRDGAQSVEIEVYTDKGWISFDDMINGGATGGDGTSDQS